MVNLRTILGSVIMISTLSSAVHAKTSTALEGLFEVQKACELTNSRLQALTFMERAGDQVAIGIDLKAGHLLISNYYKEVMALPLESRSKLKHFLIKDYFKKGQVAMTENSYSFVSRGSLLTTCDNEPLPGKRLCRLKWDDAVTFQTIDDETIKVQWKFDKASGVCSLKRI